ncbi:Alanine--tRNA ligase like protein [Argiope bruennichi]|uniref:alanine--tRNA ligase n=1 Tax=Argiope bruennichi TaxID=94029 RepID=A0A8T0FCD9_ARGBR|nr:Alanine--tRNA ligase like protein [Argiope bruennichi]
MDVINDEETQFLKTLNRGRQLLERAIKKLDSKVLPGDIAWRLYDTYGFPIDLTQLMVEEKGLQIDMAGYEEAKKQAQLMSQAKGEGAIDEIKLDVHAISELQEKKVPPTDDMPKYSYRAVSDNKESKYEFEPCVGTILALRIQKAFTDKVENGQECGIILDRTSFYAESGGQIYDLGFMDTEFSVKEVQLQGGYVIHIGTLCGTLKVGDKLKLLIDEVYPDPVRVVSIGISVDDLLADPSGPGGTVTSVEFCGGTHLKRSGHVGDFVIASEEAIAKDEAKLFEENSKDNVQYIGSEFQAGLQLLGKDYFISYKPERRKLIMNNHTGTHILNFALRKALATECDQKGSLVAPDRLRFDFTNKGAMTVAQVKEAELVANEVISKNEEVYAKEAPLPNAKAVQGLRAVFGENAFNIKYFFKKLSDPSGPGGKDKIVEFCGGTHLKRSGHVGDFVIASEEAIAKGIRRIVALSGPEATKAIKRSELFQNEVENLKNLVEDKNRNINEKEIVKKIVELTEEISQSNISYWKKDEMRNNLKNLKKKLDDLDRANKAAVVQTITDEAKKLFEENSKDNVQYIVHEFQAGFNAKALDAALKQAKLLTPDTAVMLFTKDSENEKVLCMSAVPKTVTSKGLKANEWVQHVTQVIGGKGGGKPESAQATGTNANAVNEAINLAKTFAEMKLS